MTGPAKLKVVVVSAFHSEGMGYSENCLPKTLAALGHDVHVVTSTFNVYGNTPEYDRTYRSFLGPARVEPGTSTLDGYTLHRLPARIVRGYVRIEGLIRKVRSLEPDIVHSLEIASLQTFALALARPLSGYRLFCETHQHMSVVRPYLQRPNGARLRKTVYRLTRTLPTHLASTAVDVCYAISPDCVEVATRFYGVPASKVKLQSLGTDTMRFHPVANAEDVRARNALRGQLGFCESDIVCVYSGRFSEAKNPLILAEAIDALSESEARFKGLFIGEGAQRDAICACRNTVVIPFMTHRRLADHYRAADIAVWPTQESMSMLDAAASGLPVVASDRMGERERVNGNGRLYEEPSVDSMARVLASLADPCERRTRGLEGRKKMVDRFSWIAFARSVEADYLTALARNVADVPRGGDAPA